ncbi:MAG: DUF5654 family protein [bacterium]|nr:DUF5654 family protein [bacterium]
MINVNNKLDKIKSESSKISREVKDRTFGFIITALSLVAGLAWNEAIQSLINNYFAMNKNSILAKFVYAVILTLILTLITIYLAKIFGRNDQEKE